MRKLEENEVASIASQAIHNFNNLKTKARPAFGTSRNIMEENGNAIKHSAGDWIHFLVDWKKQAEQRHQEALKRAEQRHQEVLKQFLDNKEQRFSDPES